jgi:hypothetical protein
LHDRIPRAEPTEQARAVADVLARARGPLDLDTIAAHFTARGGARRDGDTWRAG